MRGGEIFGNTAYEYGGGVYVNEDGTFTKVGGTIHGYSEEDSSSNVVEDSVDVLSYRGHAVYVDSVPAKFRETTAVFNVNLDSNVPGIEGGWEN
jgi:predicted outer membrane repeat protein